MRIKRAIATVTLVGLGATFFLGTGPASASADASRDADDATLAAALDEHADELGISTEELEARMEKENAFAVAVTDVQEQFPNDYLGASVADGSASVSFKGAAPDKAVTILRESAPDATIIGQVGWNEKEISEAGEDLHYRLYEELGDGVATSIDAREGTITITVPSMEFQNALRVVDSESDSTDRSELSQFAITVEADADLATGEDAIYGGGALTSCTAGWSVSKSGYPNALITAAHCSNSQTFTGGVALSFRAESSNRDVRWHSSSITANPAYYTGSGWTYVFGKANPVEGQSLCKYGKTSHYTCDTTYLDNQCRDSYCDMMTMNNRKAASGDSGAPWFSGNTAYGVHSGYVTIWLVARDMFTPINSGLTSLGISLKTSTA